MNQPPTSGTTSLPERWFVTAPAVPEDFFAVEPRVPRLVIHAKTMGTNRTACGMATGSWTKLWDVTFDAIGLRRRCPGCVAQTTAPGGAHPQADRQTAQEKIA
jgi:hypothetical protein